MIEVTIEEVDSTNWKKVLTKTKEKKAFSYFDSFIKAKKQAQE